MAQITNEDFIHVVTEDCNKQSSSQLLIIKEARIHNEERTVYPINGGKTEQLHAKE